MLFLIHYINSIPTKEQIVKCRNSKRGSIEEAMEMTRSSHFCALSVVVVVVMVIGYVDAVAMVMGNVFCDECQDGRRTMFDLPVNGAKVTVECKGQSEEVRSDLMGNFVMNFDGAPDLSGCSARVVQSPPNSECNVVSSPAKPLTLVFRMLGMEMYTVESLSLQPAKSMSLCPNSNNITNKTPPPAIISVPPLPFVQASACPYDVWVKPEYACNWRVVGPDTKVGVVFGEEAVKKFGQNMTLWEGLHGRGDVLRTLLREGTASLLNSYNSLGFAYNPLSVVMRMHSALHSGSPQYALKQAFHFKKANIGGGNTKCLLKPCK